MRILKNHSPGEATYESVASSLDKGWGLSVVVETDGTKLFVSGPANAPTMPLEVLLSLFKNFVGRKRSPHYALLLNLGASIHKQEDLDALALRASWAHPHILYIRTTKVHAAYLKTKSIPFHILVDTQELSGAGIVCSNDPSADEAALHAQVTPAQRFFIKIKEIAKELSFRGLDRRLRRMRYLLFMSALNFFERRSGMFFTFHVRPIYAKDIDDSADPLVNPPSCAIVMQGPVLKTYDFTLETVRMYKKLFPCATVIVSTWRDEDVRGLALLKAEGADIVLNDKPAHSGPYNVNFQLTSAMGGLRRAKELGCAYALKTRTDHRIYNKNIFETMTNMLEYFAPSERSGQRKRILFTHGGNKYQPYMTPDVFAFGDTDDMLEYWSAPLVSKSNPYPLFLPEMYLTTTFLKKKGWPMLWDVNHWWDVYRECFLAIDWHDVELYWYKYRRFREYMDRKHYHRTIPNMDQMSFYDWFNIYTNKDNKRILPEHAMVLWMFPPDTKSGSMTPSLTHDEAQSKRQD